MNIIISLTTIVLFTTPMNLKGLDDDADVYWGPTSSDECDDSQPCPSQHKCCVKNTANTCQDLNDIGHRCSSTKAPHCNKVYLGTCPCERPFTCKDMGENISICVPPQG
ncbi:uncharacterized protein LOC142771653 isoform X1 [Rhipicephalus microplus]|uniref:uncharacterized protein LOC142771653 isoform X1 n=1 Tax=Rhipicephalus microplus TaxID=6941 RepID=UPI0023767B89